MKKVVVIDDESLLRENMMEILQLAGYMTFGADTAEKGLELIHTVRPDLVLCDIRMPDHYGYWVLEQLRKDQTFSNTPFIFVTAKVETKDIRQGMGMGADDYITKPFNASELLQTVEARIKRIQEIKSGMYHKSESGQATQVPSESSELLNKLTRSEREIVSMIADGMSSAEIAEKRFNSIKTIENHRSNIIAKLGLNGHLSLVKFCISIKPLIETSSAAAGD
ncbi:MAG: response regulator transcription factor [Bacteroidia bacterium]